MQQDHSLTHLTVLSPPPADMVIGAARAELHYVGDELIKVALPKCILLVRVSNVPVRSSVDVRET